MSLQQTALRCLKAIGCVLFLVLTAANLSVAQTADKSDTQPQVPSQVP